MVQSAWIGPVARWPGDPEEGLDVFLPDAEIVLDDPAHVLHPMRGNSVHLAVFDIDDRPIGWMHVGVLGFEDVKAWMIATNYLWRPWRST